LNIEPAINIRSNASIKTKGCPLRRDEVLLIRKLGYDWWKKLKDAGRRWIAEIVFSPQSREYLVKISFQRNSLHKK
jgi:hypothetical protein